MGFYTNASTNTMKLLSLPEGYKHTSQFAPIKQGNDQAFGCTGNYFWSDGKNVYLSNDYVQYKFNKETRSWEVMDWGDIKGPQYGYDVWTDGTHIYGSCNLYDAETKTNAPVSLRLNKETMKWEVFKQAELTYAGNLWSDGTHIYETSNTYVDIWDPTTETWSPYDGFKGEAGFWFNTRYSPFNIGDTIYHRDTGRIYTLKDVVGGKRWVYSYPDTWDNWVSVPVNGKNVWHLNGAIYHSEGTEQSYYDNTELCWKSMTWTGLTSFDGENVWTDGTNYYYSSDTSHYMLDIATSTWSVKTWSGLSNFVGANIWEFNGSIYYSKGSTQYKLNVETSTWEAFTWTGLTSFNRANVWINNSKAYCSMGSTHYYLDGVVWKTKTWSVSTSFTPKYMFRHDGEFYLMTPYGSYIWDTNSEDWTTTHIYGTHIFSNSDIWEENGKIYYKSEINSNKCYSLNKDTKVWTEESSSRWSILGSDFRPDCVFKLGDTYYYYYYRYSPSTYYFYYLDNEDDTWKSMPAWGGYRYGINNNLWTDGEHVYCTYNDRYDKEWQNVILIEESCDRYIKQHGQLIKDYAGINGSIEISSDGEYDVTEVRKAVVKIEVDYLGTWLLNREIHRFPCNNQEMAIVDFTCTVDGVIKHYNQFTSGSDETEGASALAAQYLMAYCTDTDTWDKFYDYDTGWVSEDYRTITITDEPTLNQTKGWLLDSGVKQ